MTPPAPAPGHADHDGPPPPSPPAAIVLTFDNLGEASDLERGDADGGAPAGAHPSVTIALPRLLRELSALGLSATFFVEAINCGLNPGALDAIAAAGHEIGVHGWRHEPWAALDPSRERALLVRSGRAFASRGLAARAFRPPGGELTAHTVALLHEFGYRWCSPLGAGARVRDGLGVVGFDWELVDAYHLMESFASLRTGRGDPRRPAAAHAVADRMIAGLRAGEGVRTLILHPFLMVDDAWWEATRRVLAALADLVRGGHARVGPGGPLITEMSAPSRSEPRQPPQPGALSPR